MVIDFSSSNIKFDTIIDAEVSSVKIKSRIGNKSSFFELRLDKTDFLALMDKLEKAKAKLLQRS